jgi:hypothetical protein
MNLSDVVAAFTESRADWDPLHAVSITSESSSSISIALNVEGRQFAISALYIMPDSYPSSGCLLTERSESSGSTDSKLQDKLAAVSEKLQDKAPFSVVLKRASAAACCGLCLLEPDELLLSLHCHACRCVKPWMCHLLRTNSRLWNVSFAQREVLAIVWMRMKDLKRLVPAGSWEAEPPTNRYRGPLSHAVLYGV